MGKLTVARKTLWNGGVGDRIAKVVRDEHIDVAHFHNTFPLVSPAAYYAARGAGAAVVQTLHNYRLLCPGATFYRDGKPCESCLGRAFAWPGVAHKCYRGNRGATAVTALLTATHRAAGTYHHAVDRFVALTEFARGKFVEGGLPAHKIATKPNFLDGAPPVGDGRGGFVLFVGRLTEEKGIRELLRAWQGVDVEPKRLVIVGDGPLRGEVERAAGAQRGVEYLGRQPLERVMQLMGEAAALAFPSTWYEGMPRTIVESFARGTPVVAFDLGSMPALVRPGSTGWLAPAGDEAALTNLLISVLRSPDAAAALRPTCRAAFDAEFTADRNYRLLRDIYSAARIAYTSSTGREIRVDRDAGAEVASQPR
jgi:glycosyltransferase involved in cell wall biosynthesis